MLVINLAIYFVCHLKSTFVVHLYGFTSHSFPESFANEMMKFLRQESVVIHDILYIRQQARHKKGVNNQDSAQERSQS
jgi:hypothetical protein